MESVSKVIEISAASSNSIEDAVQSGLKKVAGTVNNLRSAWINEIKVISDGDGNVKEWRVNMRVNFLVE